MCGLLSFEEKGIERESGPYLEETVVVSVVVYAALQRREGFAGVHVHDGFDLEHRQGYAGECPEHPEEAEQEGDLAHRSGFFWFWDDNWLGWARELFVFWECGVGHDGGLCGSFFFRFLVVYLLMNCV
jgi:hypothetical protein